MILERIEKFAAELAGEEIAVTPEMELLKDVGLDSIDTADLVFMLEGEYDVEIDDETLETIRTVGDLIRAVEAQK